MSDGPFDPCYLTEKLVNGIFWFFRTRIVCKNGDGEPSPYWSGTCGILGLCIVVLIFPLLTIFSVVFFLLQIAYEIGRSIISLCKFCCDVYEVEEDVEQPINVTLPPPSKDDLKQAVNLILEYGDEDYQILTCMVCRVKQVDIVLSPCRHAKLCQDCAQRIDSCPFCRQKINKRVEIFT